VSPWRFKGAWLITMQLLRSLIFVPGNRPLMMEKARWLPADALVLDLEDSVPAAEKASAALEVHEALPTASGRRQKVYVRVNGLATGRTEEELETVVGPALDGICFPKATSAQEVHIVDALLSTLEAKRGMADGHVKMIPWLETARGIVNAFEVASASPRIVAVSYGAEDFTLDMGIPRSLEGAESLVPRALVAIAARASGVLALDSPYPDFKDEAGLVKDAKVVRNLGYAGKFAVHPAQIAPLHQVFSPSAEEVARARAILEAYDEALARGSASTSLSGMLIDVPIAERARKLLAWANAIAERESNAR